MKLHSPSSDSGGAGTLSIIPGHASIVNQVFAKFISRRPPTRSELRPPETPKRERMQKALSTLAEIMGDSGIASRDPLSSLSFCCLSPEIIQRQTDMLVHYQKKSNSVFRPLGPEGRPIRRCITCYCCFQASICFQIFRQESKSLVS